SEHRVLDMWAAAPTTIVEWTQAPAEWRRHPGVTAPKQPLFDDRFRGSDFSGQVFLSRDMATRMKYRSIVASIWLFLGLIGQIHATDSYPTHAVTMMVPYGAGGTVDSQLRALAKASEGHLGQPVVIENRASASGTLAAEVTAAAPADGYTITVINTSVLRLPF